MASVQKDANCLHIKRLFICFHVVFHSFVLPDLLFASFCLCIEPLLSPTDTIQVSLHCLFFKLVPPSIIFIVLFSSSGGFVTVVALIFFLQILTCLSGCPFVSLLSLPGNYFRSPPSCYLLSLCSPCPLLFIGNPFSH